jgi:hypothetical protein
MLIIRFCIQTCEIFFNKILSAVSTDLSRDTVIHHLVFFYHTVSVYYVAM